MNGSRGETKRTWKTDNKASLALGDPKKEGKLRNSFDRLFDTVCSHQLMKLLQLIQFFCFIETLFFSCQPSSNVNRSNVAPRELAMCT